MAINLPTQFVVSLDELPDFVFEIDVETPLSTTFSSITLDVRRPDRSKIMKAAIVDDDENGIFHFEWTAGDLIEGAHYAELVLVDINTSKPLTLPERDPIRFVARGRV